MTHRKTAKSEVLERGKERVWERRVAHDASDCFFWRVWRVFNLWMVFRRRSIHGCYLCCWSSTLDLTTLDLTAHGAVGWLG